VMDSSRIKATLKTLEWILEKKPRWVVIISHLGRPDGQPDEKYSLQPAALRLQQLLGRPVLFINECVGDTVI
jgi:phosphoglycerate kinase